MQKQKLLINISGKKHSEHHLTINKMNKNLKDQSLNFSTKKSKLNILTI